MGIVISESGAEKLKSYKVEKTEVPINTNDVLLNLYGDSENYKSYPKIGEHTSSKVLVAARRIDYGKSFYDLNDSRLREIDPLNDELTYTEEGTVVDIDYFCNIPLEQLKQKNNAFSKELVTEIEEQYEYYRKLATALEKIIPIRPKTESEMKRSDGVIKRKRGQRKGGVHEHVPVAPIPTEENPNKYSDDLAYLWKKSHEYIDEKIKWREDGKSFENVKIQFTILKENPLVEGCKITGQTGSFIQQCVSKTSLIAGTERNLQRNYLNIKNEILDKTFNDHRKHRETEEASRVEPHKWKKWEAPEIVR